MRRFIYAAAPLMPEMLDRIRKELNSRIGELRPVLREVERLERAARALARMGARSVPGRPSQVGPVEADRAAGARGRRGARPAAARPTARPTSPARRGPAPHRKTAPRGQTQARVLEALAAAPGSGPTAVSRASGVSTGVAGATLSRLVKQGRVRRLEAGGYAIVEADTAARPAEEAAAAQTPPPEPG